MRDHRLLRFRRWPALWLAVVGVTLPAARAADPAPGAADPLQSVLRLNAASQAFSYYGPWQKRNVVSLSGLATLVGDNLFLTPAALVQDRTQVELEKLRNGEKAPAEVIGVDYEADLALVRCRDAAFVAGLQPLPVSPKLPAGTAVTAWQFEDNGSPVATAGRFRRADVGAYPYGRFLSYEIEIALPVTETPPGTPAVADGQLVGLLLGYNSGTRALTVMAPEVIRHFLQDFGDGTYEGFPQAGFGYSPLGDPQLRSYLGLPVEADGPGVYVASVRAGSPAATAGLKPGDVLLGLDEFPINRLGEYEDPDYGKLNLGQILSTRSFAGEVRTFKVWRDRQELALKVPLAVLPPAAWPVEPFVFDRPPHYVLAGGLLFMELSRQLLKEWGNEWQKTAPQRLLYLERNQWDVCQPGEKIIILTRIIKAAGNGGYDGLRLRALRKVNGRDIKNLRDITAALESPERGQFQTFEFDSPTYKIVLDARQMAADDAALKRVIPELVRLPAAPPATAAP